MRLALFAYDFPHKKTQDFLFRLLIEELVPSVVLAAPHVDLRVPPPAFRVKPRHLDLIHPRDLCRRLGIPYEVVAHNSPECCDQLRHRQIDIGVIAGARILRKPVLRAVSKGIINFHPGLIPEVRGLDTLQWAVLEGLPFGVTTHVIDERVDAGRIIMRETIPEYPDDTLIDLSLRLEETQTNMVAEAIRLVDQRPLSDFPLVPEGSAHRGRVPAGQAAAVPEKLASRLAQKEGS